MLQSPHLLFSVLHRTLLGLHVRVCVELLGGEACRDLETEPELPGAEQS